METETRTAVGFLGFGHMAQAIAEGWNHQKMEWIDVFAYAPHQEKLENNCALLGAHPCRSLQECAAACDVLILSCKPAQVSGVLEGIKTMLEGKLIICLAAGISNGKLESMIPDTTHVSIMPNTAVAQAAGTIVVEDGHTLDDGQMLVFESLFAPLALIETVSAAQFGIAGTIAGCSPAFLGLYAEALADAGVKYGLSRPVAQALAAQAVFGAGSMMASGPVAPSVFKDNICSPGGTTIKGIVSLEKDGFRGDVIQAIEAIMEA